MVPMIKGDTTPEQRRFVAYHKKGRSVIERTFGVMKSKWRRLLVSNKYSFKERSILRYSSNRLFSKPFKKIQIYHLDSIKNLN